MIVPRLMRFIVKLDRPETTVVTNVGLAFGFAYLAAAQGYSVALGAFLAGSLVAESGVQNTIEKLVQPVRDIFAAIFFVSVGMLIDPAQIALYWPVVLVFLVVVVVGKVGSVSLSALVDGAKRADGGENGDESGSNRRVFFHHRGGGPDHRSDRRPVVFHRGRRVGDYHAADAMVNSACAPHGGAGGSKAAACFANIRGLVWLLGSATWNQFNRQGFGSCAAATALAVSRCCAGGGDRDRSFDPGGHSQRVGARAFGSFATLGRCVARCRGRCAFSSVLDWNDSPVQSARL